MKRNIQKIIASMLTSAMALGGANIAFAVLIGYRIRQERVQRNISQPEMADILGISYSYYNNIEKGNRSCPIEVLIEICREFGISSDRILRDFVPVDTGEFCLK